MPASSQSVAIGRRSFLKLVGGTVAYMAGGSLVFGAELPASVKRSLAFHLATQLPRFDGAFVFDEATCREMAQDFGHYVHRMPFGVLLPRSANDFVSVVKYAREQKLKIGMRGHGCSAYGQVQVQGGIVINSESFSGISWVGDDALDVEPGANWYQVTNFSMARGMAPPVCPDTLFLTVGGSLSVGGLGETSYRLGAMVDHVEELDVVTGAGELITCSAHNRSDLFRAVLAGMGQCGLITRARIRVLPVPAKVVMREFQYSQYAPFLDDLAILARTESPGAIGARMMKGTGRPNSYFAAVYSWLAGDSEGEPPSWLEKVSGTLVAQPKVMSFSEYLNRNTKSYLDAINNGSILVPHPYVSFFLPEKAAYEMLKLLNSDPGLLLGAGTTAVFPMLARNFRQALQSMPAGDLVFHMRLYRKPAVEGSADHLRMLKLNEEVFVPWVLAAGGTMYLPHAPILRGEQWRRHFGEDAWNLLARSKETCDRERVLNPGAGIFV